MCDGRPRRVVVQGTTITTPARLSLSGSADTTTAGRRPDCSRPTGSPKSTSQTSPRCALALSALDSRRALKPTDRAARHFRRRAPPLPPPRRSHRLATRRTRPTTGRRTPDARARPGFRPRGWTESLATYHIGYTVDQFSIYPDRAVGTQPGTLSGIARTDSAPVFSVTDP